MSDVITFNVRVTRTNTVGRETVAQRLAKQIQQALEHEGYLDVSVTSDAAPAVPQPCS